MTERRFPPPPAWASALPTAGVTGTNGKTTTTAWIAAALRNAVAAKAVACLNATSGTQDACDYTKSESCATEAIRTACVQPSTFNACSPVVSQCAGYSWGKLAMADCQALLSAVKDGKRKSMITCMTEGCSIESCTWMLR